jgi:uncharacterized repeat protein (TIGR01451 family)
MQLRFIGVFLLVLIGIMASISTVTSAPSDAPLQQGPETAVAQTAQAVLTQTAVAGVPLTQTAVAGIPLTQTAVAALTPSPTRTITPSPTQTGLVDLTVFISASPDPVATGGLLTYTITVMNVSPTGASSPPTTVVSAIPNGTVLSTAPPSGCSTSGTFTGSTVSCPVPSIAANQQVIFSFTVQVQAGAGTQIFNDARVDTQNQVVEINEGNNFAQVTTTVGTATATAGPTLTPVPTTDPGPPTPVPPGPTAVPPPTGGTQWVRILVPQQVFSVTDDPLWIAQNDELYWIAREESGWLLVVWEFDSKAWSVWIRDQGVMRLTLDRPAPPDAGDIWLVVFQPVQAYFTDMRPAWIALPGEWYFVILIESGWALGRYETDPPNFVVWIQEGPQVEYTTFDAPHQIG